MLSSTMIWVAPTGSVGPSVFSFRLLALVTVALLAVLACGCGNPDVVRPSDGAPVDSIPPVAPVLLDMPPDDSPEETGIDAVPEQDAIILHWLASPAPDLAAYRVYRVGGGAAPLDTISSVPGFSPDTFYIDATVNVGTRYFYAVTAVDTAANESTSSDTLNYMLIPKPFPNIPVTSSNRTPRFEWNHGPGPWPPQYIVKVYDTEDNRFVWIGPPVSPFQDFPTGFPEILYNSDGGALVDSLVVGRTYRWRVDAVGSSPRSGAESNWREFKVE